MRNSLLQFIKIIIGNLSIAIFVGRRRKADSSLVEEIQVVAKRKRKTDGKERNINF